MKDLGEAQKILGVKIIRRRLGNQIMLSQVEYCEKVLGKFSMRSSKPTPIPFGGYLELSKADRQLNLRKGKC